MLLTTILNLTILINYLVDNSTMSLALFLLFYKQLILYWYNIINLLPPVSR